MIGGNIAIHEREVPFLLGERKRKLKGITGSIIGFILGILLKFIKTQKIVPDLILKDGDVIGGLKVIHSPGHTEGHISLYDQSSVLFSGDAIITDKHSQIKGFNKVAASDTLEASKTINKIKHMKFEVLLPGHGSPVLKNASDKLNKYNKI